jgi:predicted DCC family thiol-disulfide oxidoreductase YuxK
MPAVTDDTAVLLYDGDCGLCAGSVQFVLRHESPGRRDRLRFAPLQGEYGARIRAAFPELNAVDSVVWYDPTGASATVLVRSAAALAVARHLGGVWAVLGTLGRLVPRPLRDALYDLVARNRLRLVAQACLLPRPDERARFLD